MRAGSVTSSVFVVLEKYGELLDRFLVLRIELDGLAEGGGGTGVIGSRTERPSHQVEFENLPQRFLGQR